MKPPASHQAEEAEAPAAEEKITLSPGIAMLCHLALADHSTREWLKAQGSAAGIDPNGAILDRIVSADIAEGSVPAFLSALGGAAERALSALDLSRDFPEPLRRAQETWAGLVAHQLGREIEGLKNRLAAPGISPEERGKIQKQILDLKIKIADCFRPSR